jgi:hypothetical protein
MQPLSGVDFAAALEVLASSGIIETTIACMGRGASGPLAVEAAWIATKLAPKFGDVLVHNGCLEHLVAFIDHGDSQSQEQVNCSPQQFR